MISSTSETVAMALHMESDREQGKQTCKTLCSMMQDYPNLEELDLVSYSHEYSLNTVLSHTTGAPLFANLAYLSLLGVNVASGGSDGFCHNLDLALLQDLRMIGCDYLKPFFDGLSRFYAKDTGKLRALHIDMIADLNQPKDTIQALEKLLKVCPKLSELNLELDKHEVVAKECLLEHAETLCSFVVGAEGEETITRFPVEDVKIVLKACMKLKWLALHLPSVHLGPLGRLGADYQFGTCFESVLVSSREVTQTSLETNNHNILNSRCIRHCIPFECSTYPS
jgi:hypothetical protein